MAASLVPTSRAWRFLLWEFALGLSLERARSDSGSPEFLGLMRIERRLDLKHCLFYVSLPDCYLRSNLGFDLNV